MAKKVPFIAKHGLVIASGQSVDASTSTLTVEAVSGSPIFYSTDGFGLSGTLLGTLSGGRLIGETTGITVPVTDNSTKIATTEFVQSVVVGSGQLTPELSGRWQSTSTTVNANSAKWDLNAADITEIANTSGYWNSVHSTVKANSADWAIISVNTDDITNLANASGDWNLAHSLVVLKQDRWDSTYSVLTASSAVWQVNADDITNLANASGDWNSVYSSVNTASSDWDSTFSTLNTSSADWESVFTSVTETSAVWDSTTDDITNLANASGDWESVYTVVKTNSGSWGTESAGGWTDAGGYVHTSNFNTDRVVIGSNTEPSTIFEVVSSTGGLITLKRVDSQISSGDILGEIRAVGNETTDQIGAKIAFKASDHWETDSDTTDAPTQIEFWTSTNSEAASQKMVLTDTGKLGIGEIAPGSHITVVGDISASGNIYAGESILGAAGDTARTNSVFTTVTTNSADWSYVAANSSNNAKADSVYTTVDTKSASWDTAATRAAANESTLSNASNWTSTYNQVQDSTTDFNVDSGTLFVDKSEDRVGIGTTSPVRPLHVDIGSNDIGIRLQSSDDIAKIEIGDGSTAMGKVWFGASGDLAVMTASHADNKDLIIDGTGKVGIGTETPSEKLTVGGYIKANSGFKVGSATSDEWISAQSTVNTFSADWNYVAANSGEGTKIDSVYTNLNSNSADWQSTYSNSSSNSAYWSTVYTTVNTESAGWGLGSSKWTNDGIGNVYRLSRVGINKSAPIYTLDVEGTARISDSAQFNGNVTFAGSTTFVQSVNLNVADKSLVINYGSGAETATNAGLYVEESGVNTAGFVRTTSDRSGWEIKEPAGGNILTLDINADKTLTINGGLDIEGDSAINQDLTTDSTNVQFAKLGIGSTVTDNAFTFAVTGTDAMLIPTGSTANRPSQLAKGLIRFNSELVQFEGYDGTKWSGLGKTTDSDGDTKVVVELANDDDTLRLYTAGSERATVTNTGDFLVGTDEAAVQGVTVSGHLSALGTVFLSSGNSNQWNEAYSSIQSNQSNWDLGYNSYVTTNSTSARWESAFTTLNTNSGSGTTDYYTKWDSSGKQPVDGVIYDNGAITYIANNLTVNEDLTTVGTIFTDGIESTSAVNITYSGTTRPALVVKQSQHNAPIFDVQGPSNSVFKIFDGNSVAVGNNMGPEATVSFSVCASDAMRIPVGTPAARPAAAKGLIRYNLTSNQFEGCDGDIWSGFGGVIDSDGDTLIIAEQGEDDDTLRLRTQGTDVVTIVPTNRVGIMTDAPGAPLTVVGDISGNGDIYTAGATFEGHAGIAVPTGTTAERPTNKAGTLRYNTTTDQFEGNNGSQWTGLGGVIDVDGNTRILAEEVPGQNDDTLFFETNGTRVFSVSGSVIKPHTDNTIDLGTSDNEFKNLYLTGTANIDSLVVDTADINGGTIDSTTVGSVTPSTGKFTGVTIVGDVSARNTLTTHTANVSGNIHVAGTSTLASVDINGGTLTGITQIAAAADIDIGPRLFTARQIRADILDLENEAPFIVTATTKVDNLNADMVDGLHAPTASNTAIVGTTDTQTLTNKTLTSPAINTAAINGGTVGAATAITEATIDNIKIDGANIGHTDDTDLIALSNGVVTVNGTIDVDTLKLSDNGDNKILVADSISFVPYQIIGDISISRETNNGVKQLRMTLDSAVELGTGTTGSYVKWLGESGVGTTITGNPTNSEGITPSISVDYGSTAGTAVQGNTNITINGTSNEIEITGNAAQALGGGPSYTVGLPSDVTIGNNLTVTGNLTVNGSTTTVDTTTLTVEDPLIKLASNNNTTDVVDIGFYALYDDSGSADEFTGLFRDASDQKWKLFKNLDTEPTTTVDITDSSYAVATLVAHLEDSNTTITGGAIDGTVIGNTTPAAGTFTDLTVNDSLTVAAGASFIGDTTGEVTVNVKGVTSQTAALFNIETSTGDDKLTISPAGQTTVTDLVATTADINGGTIDSTTIGSTTPSTGKFTGVNITGSTATRLLATNSSKDVASTDLSSWITGTSNQVTVTDDSDGTVTLSAPQDIHTGATPEFAGLTVVGNISGKDVLATNHANLSGDLHVIGSVGVGTNNPAVSFAIEKSDAILIPVGTTAQRPTAAAGMVRFDTDKSQFEGYNGSNWAGLGGVIDADQDTKIVAEASTDEDKLRFYTAGSQRMVITNTGLVGIGNFNPDPRYNFSVQGTISATNVIYTSTGSSLDWQSVYTTVSDTSAKWKLNQDDITNVAKTSADWNSVYTQVNDLSAGWEGAVHDITNVATASGGWNDTKSTVDSKESTWDTAATKANANETNITTLLQDVTEVANTSAGWNETKATVDAHKAVWTHPLSSYSIGETITINHSLTAGMACRLDVGGTYERSMAGSDPLNLATDVLSAEVLGIVQWSDATYSNNIWSGTKFEIVYSGTCNLPDHDLGDPGVTVFLSTSDEGKLTSACPTVDNTINKPVGTIIDNNTILVQPFRGEKITKQSNNADDWNSTHTTVNSNSGTWGSGVSVYTTVNTKSANWDTAYSDRLKWDGGSGDLNAGTGRTSLGLGSIATQNADNVNIDGGTIDGASVGSTAAAAGAFTTLKVTTPGSAPATATATGVKGEIRYDEDYIYICVATNTWKRSALAAW